MSSRGKGGKGLGKGGAKRHRKVLRDNIQGITKPDIRRLARRGGTKRISGLIYEETKGTIKDFLKNVINDAVTYTEHVRRKTVSALDIVHALKRQGRTLYGLNDGKTRNPYKPKVLDTITIQIFERIKSLEREKQSMDEVAKIVCELIPLMMFNVKATPKAQERMRKYLTTIVGNTFVGQQLLCINDIDHNLSHPAHPDCHKLTALKNGLKGVIDAINASGCDAATWMKRADEELAKKVLKQLPNYLLECPELKDGVESYLFNYYTTHFCLSAGWYEVFITNPFFLKLAQEGKLFANTFGEDYTIFSNSKQSVTIDKILLFLISSGAVILTGDSPKDIDMVLPGIETLSFATCVFKDGAIYCKAEKEADFIFTDMESVRDMARVQRILFELRDQLKQA
jgi:histone H4